MQSRGFVHFHHCELALPDPAIARVDFAAERIVRHTIYPGTIERVTNDFGRAFTAVRDEYDVDLWVGQNIAQTSCDILCDFTRAKQAFEFIGGDQDAHETSSSPQPFLSCRTKSRHLLLLSIAQ